MEFTIQLKGGPDGKVWEISIPVDPSSKDYTELRAGFAAKAVTQKLHEEIAKACGWDPPPWK